MIGLQIVGVKPIEENVDNSFSKVSVKCVGNTENGHTENSTHIIALWHYICT